MLVSEGGLIYLKPQEGVTKSNEEWWWVHQAREYWYRSAWAKLERDGHVVEVAQKTWAQRSVILGSDKYEVSNLVFLYNMNNSRSTSLAFFLQDSFLWMSSSVRSFESPSLSWLWMASSRMPSQAFQGSDKREIGWCRGINPVIEFISKLLTSWDVMFERGMFVGWIPGMVLERNYETGGILKSKAWLFCPFILIYSWSCTKKWKI